MNGLRNSNFQENEIVKASDVQLVGDVAIENLGKALKTLFGSSKNVVIGGKLTAYTGGSGLMAKMDPILGISTASEIPFSDHEGKFYSDGDTEPSSYITFASAGSSNRRDLVEVKADTITAVEQSRQFYDPETETTSYAQTDTEKRTVLRLKVKKGTNGSDTCPTTDSGYVKLAEVKIPANATSLSNSYIFNVTADIEGIDNTGWTAEKQVTINPGTLKDISTKFRAIHNSDGSLKDSVIAAAKIILSGSGALQGSAIQKGGSAEEIDGENVTASNSISTFFAKIAAKLRKVADKPTEVTQAEYDALKAAGKVEGKYFIITDAVGTEQPLIRDDLKNTTTVWSSSKTNTTINNALADLSEIKVTQKTDANLCYPTNYHKSGVFYCPDNSTNTPIANEKWTIISTRVYNVSSSHLITQIALSNNNNKEFIRKGYIVPSTSVVTFADWEKVETETDLNGALADFTISDFNFNPTTIIADNNVGSKRFNTTFNPSNKPTGTNFFYGTLFHNTSGQYYLVGYDYSGTMFERRYLTSTSEWVDVTEVANKTWVNGALANYTKNNNIAKGIASPGWYRLCEIATGVSGAIIELEITTMYYNSETSSKKIIVSIGWTNHNIEVISCSDNKKITTQLRLNVKGTSSERKATIDVYYAMNQNNSVYTKINCKQATVTLKSYEAITEEVTGLIADITATSLSGALANYQKVFSSGYIEAVTIKRIKRDANNRAYRFYCRGGETVYLYQGSEIIANREVDGYKKISLAYDTNYYYVTFASNAQYCYIESFYGDMVAETVAEVPSGATSITITSTDLNGALTNHVKTGTTVSVSVSANTGWGNVALATPTAPTGYSFKGWLLKSTTYKLVGLSVYNEFLSFYAKETVSGNTVQCTPLFEKNA